MFDIGREQKKIKTGTAQITTRVGNENLIGASKICKKFLLFCETSI